jgi:EAL domain-containing protein (putative c-di-GMP-specific phosphodiesterase class I)
VGNPPPLRLALELTEAFSPSGDRPEIGRLGELSQLGVDLVIDDFGTGNSSLAFVKQLPVTMIKLDGMFVTDLGTDRRAEAIVRGVIELAHRLGVRVTAEAVELPRQRDRLTALSCDLGQGFLFGRPRPARDLAPSSFDGSPSAFDGRSPAPAG